MDMIDNGDMKHQQDLAAGFNSKSFMEYYLDKLNFPPSPRTPTSVLPEFSNIKSAENSIVTSSVPYLLPLQVKAMKKLSPIDVKRLSIHMYPHVAQQISNTINQTEESNRDSEVIKDHVVLVENSEGNCDGFLRVEMEMQMLTKSIVVDDGQSTTVAVTSMSPLSSARDMPLLSEASAQPECDECIGSKISPPGPPLTPGNVSPPTSSPPYPRPPSLTSCSGNKQPPPPPPTPPVYTSRIESPPLPHSTRTSHIATPLKHSPPSSPPPLLPMSSGDATIMRPLVSPPAPRKPGPPPAPMTPRTIPPPPMQQAKGGAPPPPPPAIVGTRSLRAKATTKLKRSSQMGSLYRLLKGKVEGSSLDSKSLKRTNSKIGGASGGNGKQSMADALAEMTKRSSYFIQIEEDVKNYANAIKEVKAALSSFQTTDMAELVKFHMYVESHMEKLTDESQVLARFEDFPCKKLEGLRMAAALHAKLDAIATTLQNWKIESPANQLIDKAENYFNKIKGELDDLERCKDTEIKKFKSQNIHFDFAILTRIKELMVEVSSNCMEVALKETREPRVKEQEGSGIKIHGKKSGSGKILWRAFQFAFRVYTFAGGQDDRADILTKELAQEIEINPHR